MFDVGIAILDWLGVMVFAATGALVASRKQMDLVGFAVLGTVTGIGGGTLRDLLLGQLPVFWIREPAYLVVSVAASTVVFFTAHLWLSRWRTVLWLDAVGLALFAVIGAEKALVAGATWPVAIIMGVITATLGGMIRDVLGGESPVVLSKEIYVTAALLSAAIFIAGTALALPREGAVGLGVLAGFGVRGAALRYGWSLPRYQPRAKGISDNR